MKIHELDDDGVRRWLKVTDLENFFEIYELRDGRYSYNLNETVYVDADESLLREYVCDRVMQWPLVSHRIYGTTRLAWLLMKVNGVGAEEVFKNLVPGQKVKYLPPPQMQNVVGQITEYDEG